MKKLLSFIYGIGAMLIFAGAVVNIYWDIPFGKMLIVSTFIFVSIFQGWVIDKLFKQLKDKE